MIYTRNDVLNRTGLTNAQLKRYITEEIKWGSDMKVNQKRFTALQMELLESGASHWK